MATVDMVPCPRCQGPPGALSLSVVLVRTDGCVSGSFAVPTREAPVLSCSQCGMRKVGRYDGDGRHVTFSPDR